MIDHRKSDQEASGPITISESAKHRYNTYATVVEDELLIITNEYLVRFVFVLVSFVIC